MRGTNGVFRSLLATACAVLAVGSGLNGCASSTQPDSRGAGGRSSAGAGASTGGATSGAGGSNTAAGGSKAAAGASGSHAATGGNNGGAHAAAGSSNAATGGTRAGSAGDAGDSGMEQGGSPAVGGTPGALGPYPFAASPVTRGGTMTFTNVGAAGWWPRRIEREAGDPACDYKDGTDTWGGHCCMKQESTESSELSPFDSEMTLILKAINVKQLAVYQPAGDSATSAWQRVSDWDARNGAAHNLWFTQQGDGSSTFPGDLTHDDCVGYVSQAPRFDCGDGHDYYCPNDPGVLHQGFSGSKLVVFLGSMAFDDAGVKACSGDGAGKPSPWVAFVASELIRDGGRKYNGLCNCYSKTGTVGDGCGEINVFEVVMDDNDYSNREFASTGVRSFQAGHVGGAVCQASCERDQFPADADVVDACAKTGYATGPELAFGGDTSGCPVWRRPAGDRYFFILLDQAERMIQVGMLHPANLPPAAAAVLPAFPGSVARSAIDALLALRLPG